MAAVTICSDFGAQKIKSDTVSTVPHLFPMKSKAWGKVQKSFLYVVGQGGGSDDYI